MAMRGQLVVSLFTIQSFSTSCLSSISMCAEDQPVQSVSTGSVQSFVPSNVKVSKPLGYRMPSCPITLCPLAEDAHQDHTTKERHATAQSLEQTTFQEIPALDDPVSGPHVDETNPDKNTS